MSTTSTLSSILLTTLPASTFTSTLTSTKTLTVLQNTTISLFYSNSSSENLTRVCEIYTTAASETSQVPRSAGDGIRLSLSSSMIRFGTGVSGSETATAAGAVGTASASASSNQTEVLQSSGAVGGVRKKWRTLGLMLCVGISVLGAIS